MGTPDPLQTVAFPQSSRSRHLLQRLQGINFWCDSVRGSAAGLEEETASFVTASYARPLEAKRPARGGP